MVHLTVQISITLALLLFLPLATATSAVQRRQSITTLSSAQVASFKPYTFFASTAYCDPSTTKNWTCGANCDANPGFKPIASGGNGDSIQFWYVGFEPKLDTIVVAHQGTDLSKLFTVLTDINFIPTPLNPTLFPDLPFSILVHNGFANEHAQTATDVLAAVQQGMTQFNTTKVTLVGHSSGAALSLLDSVYLPLHLPAKTEFTSIMYGLPRVGNQAFADWIDGHDHLTHINNRKDPVPTLPPQFLGFVHPAGEVHIREDSSWVSCPEQDNTSPKCTIGDVPNFLVGDLNDHDGPYDGVTMGC